MRPFRKNTQTMPKIRRMLQIAIVACLGLANLPAAASDVNLVGALSIAADDEGARLLGLSSDLHRQIRALVAQREADGNRLLDDPDLSDLDKHDLIAGWSEESEQQGFRLLTLDQRERLLQLWLAREGLVTLARLDVAEILSLTEAQRKDVERLVDARRRAVASGSKLEVQITLRGFERKLQALLSPSQLADWENMVGFADIAPPTDPPPSDDATHTPAGQEPSTPTDGELRLRFAFEQTPWRAVLDWLAEEADLSLYVITTPTGVLTYSDRREYTLDQAVERINRFLIPLGHTLVRSGKMMSVISLDDGRSEQLLDALAEFSTLEDLDRRGDFEVVKCLFTIAKADPQEALVEISGLVKLSEPLLMPKTKQLVIIDTAARLRMVRDVLKALENPSPDGGLVRRFELQHIHAEEALAAIRPLVGIDDESANIGADVSLATDSEGKQIFATGSTDQLAVVESVIEMLDKSTAKTGTINAPRLQAHSVKGSNLQMIDDVLQTLLADEDVRLAQEPKSGQLIVLATPEVHQRIEETIRQLDGETSVFETIQLTHVEPYIALSVVREMLDIPFFIDEEDEGKDFPRVDSDSRMMRVFVRGTRRQVDEVKAIIAQLEQPRETSQGPLRLLPLHGARAQRMLETARRFWPGDDEVIVFPPDPGVPDEVIEREINGAEPERAPPAADPSAVPAENTGLRTTWLQNASARLPAQEPGAVPRIAGQEPGTAPQDPAVIKTQVTSRGVLIHSDDLELLNRFEAHLRSIAGPGEFSASRMAVFFLKHVPADDAERMLSDIMRAESLARGYDDEPDSPSAIGPPRPMFSFSAPSVIADARLNRLIVQGTMTEIAQIEKHLRVIDRDQSIADVQTRGKARVIQLVHVRAAVAEEFLRSVYVGQIAGAGNAQQRAQPQQEQQQQQQQLQQLQQQQLQLQLQQQLQQRSPQVANDRSRAPNEQGENPEGAGRGDQNPQRPSGAGRSERGQQSRTQEPRMTLAVDESSNSLIIRAPDQLFEEVSELIRQIDRSATRATQVISVRGIDQESIRRVLRGLGASPPEQPAAKTPEITIQNIGQ